jgi:hypothetical protein
MQYFQDPALNDARIILSSLQTHRNIVTVSTDT